MVETTLQIDYRLGGVPQYYLTKKGRALMLVPDEVRKCVVFVCYVAKGEMKLAGTAFFVSIPTEDLGITFIYLVTARHVLEKVRRDSTDQKALIRINMKDGPPKFVGAHLGVWMFHPEDQSADVAITRWPPVPEAEDIDDFLSLPFSTFATDEIIVREGIGVGDEIFMTGLFTKHFGLEKNIPIIRVGNIALMPEEKITIDLVSHKGTADAYLVEARSIGGLSGSPVFANLSGVRKIDGEILIRTNSIYLIGLVHGHWNLSELENAAFVESDQTDREPLNTGIAVVVPVSKIIETLNREELVKERKEQKEEFQKKGMPTPDVSESEITEEEFKEALKKASRPEEAQSGEGTSET